MNPANDPAASPCYFDVTDIVRYARGNTRVSGIQRVQLNLIGDLVHKHGGQLIRCTFEHPDTREMFEFDPSPLFEDAEYDAEVLLRRLGLNRGGRLFPSQAAIRSYLRKYSDDKPRRTAVKTGIYLAALLWPARLARMGLRRPTAAELALRPLPMQRCERLPPDAHMVYLGTTWSQPEVTAFGHRQASEVVQLIHDLIPQTHPQFVSRHLTNDFKQWLADTVRTTRRFMCVSRYVAGELRRYVEGRADIEIQPVALAHEFKGFARFDPVPLEPGAVARAASAPYVLCVGTMEGRKNGIVLLNAWRRLAPLLAERLPKLVFAGKPGWLIQEFRATLATEPLAGRVEIVDSPTDRELAYLYQHCLFTVFPSLCEGWGLPVGEAAWFGKYCICSNATSLPEVCSSLNDYFDPNDVDALCTLLQRAITDPAYVRQKEQAIVHSPMRRWSDVADDIYAFVSRGPAARAGTAAS
jgi:glycosyltransferase involved in cell wall biosynthesis